MGKLSARSQSGTIATTSEMHVVNDPAGTPTSSKEAISAILALTSSADVSAAGGLLADGSVALTGNLDINTQALEDANGNELATFTATASAVNQVNITNAATGNGPTIAPAGGDTNIDLNMAGKGSGTVVIPTVTATATTTNTFGINGSSSGTTSLAAEATASGTLTLPAATDTLMGKATVDTLTNKTFDANGTGNSLTNVDVADLSSGTDGELITWDAAGAPAVVAVGTATHVLTSNGVGVAPTFQASGSGDALVANPLSQFAATTSAQLAGVLSDETGSGLAVFGTSPTLVTPALGTPSALVATNATGTAASLTSGITNALKSATTTVDVSAATAPTTGQILKATGATTATWQAESAGAPEGTAVLSTGEVAGTKFLREDGDGTCSWQAVAGSGDMILNTIQTVTGAKTFGSAGAVGKLIVAGTTSGTTILDATAVAGSTTVTLPAATDTLVGKATTDTLTNKTFDANGTGNSLSNVDVADLSNGTDGELITWDAAGAPAVVAVGTATHVLTSNGVGVAPTFQAAAGGGGSYVLQVDNDKSISPSAASLYNLGWAWDNAPATGAYDKIKIVIPKTSTLVRIDVRVHISGTLADAIDTVNHYPNINGTRDTGITIASTYNAEDLFLSGTGSISVTAGDFIALDLQMPATWTTAPTTVRWYGSFTFDL